ncbi:hypothetical protein Patl1_19831 [Pistacia atlantica]|uniref:Uncharacterized protein n=1 Tax=Pistacia atlantica TaxID=434234 RepID=A0ACC1BHR0_9ROSI|nr:hypothetical protein Patl1_19831 [Pistacia atlantica]
METTHTCRLRPTTPTPPSPRLQRSRSGAPDISPLDQSRTCNNSSLNSVNRSKSTTRSRTSTSQQQKNEEYVHPSTILASMQQKKTKESNDMNKDGFVRFLQRGIPRNNNSTICSRAAKIKSTKSVRSSPSAWALSPGRSSPYLVAPESPRPALAPVPAETRRAKSSAVGGVSGVLKYFRQKKVSPVEEGEYNRFRVLHNTLVLYRFANARAEASMASLKNVSEGRLFSGQTWSPVYDAMNKALAVMDGIEETVKRFLPQVQFFSLYISKLIETIPAEKMLYMLTELITTAEGEEEYLKELDTIFPLVPSLMSTSCPSDDGVKEKLQFT